MLWFTRSPKSLAQAAAELGMNLQRLHYHVGRLTALGLLQVVEHRPRAGRAIKLYRASYDSFFIPDHIAPRGFSDALRDELHEALDDDLGHAGGGLLFTAARNGSARGRRVGGGSAHSVEMWRVLALTPTAYAGLRDEMNALLNKYQRRAEAPGATPYLVNATLARRSSPEGIADNAR